MSTALPASFDTVVGIVIVLLDFSARLMLILGDMNRLALSDCDLVPAVRVRKEIVVSGLSVADCRSEEEIFAVLKIPYVPPKVQTSLIV